MQGPTISPVYCKRDGKVSIEYYAIVICVPKKALYESVQQLRAVSNAIHLFFHLSPFYSIRLSLFKGFTDTWLSLLKFNSPNHIVFGTEISLLSRISDVLLLSNVSSNVISGWRKWSTGVTSNIHF